MTTADQRTERRFAAVAASRTFQNVRDAFYLETKSVLDIGCSYGEFLAHFGPGSVGVTLAPEGIVYARARGLAVREGNIEDAAFLSSITEKFDVIYANNIFEHLYSPHAFLIEVKKLLKEDGILVLGVPCVPGISALLRFKKFRGSLSAEHINFFTRDTLRLTVERAGWIVERVRGFRFASAFLDHIFDAAYPHFYVAARVDGSFDYSEKRKSELRGYARFAAPDAPETR